jgi:hypothetical protein
VISKTMLHKILHNLIYYGRVRIKPWDLDTQGDFEALIDDTSAKAQLHLSETRAPITAYREGRRRATPTTTAWAARDSTFARRCSRSARAVPRHAAAQAGGSEAPLRGCPRPLERRAERVVERRIEDLRRRKERIVEAYLYENALDKETYQKHLGRVDQNLTLAELDLYDAKIDEFDIEGTLAFAEQLVSTRAACGSRPSSTSGSAYRRSSSWKASVTTGRNFRTPLTCAFSNNFEGISWEADRMVAHTGFEPVLPP